MKFKVIDESFKKYAPKDPERMNIHTDDETPEDIYNELKKEVLDLCCERALKKGESYRKRDKKMKIDKISKKISEEYKKQELNRQEFLTEIMKPTNPYERTTRLEKAYGFIEEFTQQINRSIMVENQILITELNNIKKLLNDLYGEINGNYIETLGRDDELAIDCAEAQLKLIKEIIDKVEKI